MFRAALILVGYSVRELTEVMMRSTGLRVKMEYEATRKAAPKPIRRSAPETGIKPRVTFLALKGYIIII